MAGDKLRTETRRVRLGDLKLLDKDKNARYMPADEFQQLVANIRRDGCLTSTPLVRKDGVVLSGNHRVEAAIEALGVDAEADAIVILNDLTRDQEVAIQLSHNSINGRDDPNILASLAAEIEAVEWQEYAFVEIPDEEPEAPADVDDVNEPTLTYQTLSIVFLPHDLSTASRVFDEAASLVSTSNERWAARYAEHDRMLDALDQAMTARGTKDRAAALALILDVFEAHVTDLAAEFAEAEPDASRDWVPVSTIIGTDRLPVDVAAGLARITGRFVTDGDIQPSERWRIVEQLIGLVDAYDSAADRLAAGQEES